MNKIKEAIYEKSAIQAKDMMGFPWRDQNNKTNNKVTHEIFIYLEIFRKPSSNFVWRET